MRYSVPLVAGEPARLQSIGSYMRIFGIDGARTVDVSVEVGDQQSPQRLGPLKQNAKVPMPPGVRFTAIEMTAETDAVVDVLVADLAIDLDIGEATVQQAVNIGPVAVTDVETLLGLPADPRRLSVTFYNRDDSSGPVAIIPPGTTWDERADVLQPGESVTYESGDAPHLDWRAICGPAGTANVTVKVLYA